MPALADPSCRVCQGVGFVAHGEKSQECDCKLRARARDYLTPRYEAAMYFRTMGTKNLTQDILLHAEKPFWPRETVRNAQQSVVKSFLLNTGMRYRHATLDGLYDLVKAWVSDSEPEAFHVFHRVPLLFIVLGRDPNNSRYYDLLTSICGKRKDAGLLTWVLCQCHVDDMIIRTIYGEDASKFLKDSFQITKLDWAIAQSKSIRPAADNRVTAATPPPV